MKQPEPQVVKYIILGRMDNGELWTFTETDDGKLKRERRINTLIDGDELIVSESSEANE